MSNIATQNNNSMDVCTCPHCDSASLTRFGFDRGTQRYRCKNCKKTFKATAGMPVHGLHKKEKTVKYIKALRKGLSVRKAAVYAGISTNTSFAWRHKFLSSLEAASVVHIKSETSSAQIIQLNYSAKGRKKPPEKHVAPTKTIAMLSNGQLVLHKLETVRLTHHAARVFSESTASFFAVSPHKTLTAGIKHSEKASKIKNKRISLPLIAEVKLQIARLLSWMDRFRGVASKYLQHYWNWYASLLNISQLKQETEQFCRVCTGSRSLAQYFATKNI